MKELSIEEKAKAYDSIIEKANKMHYENCEACQICIEELIPELKESEDERIRKKLILFVQNWTKKTCDYKQPPHILWTSDKEECAKILAWLEKQTSEPNWCHHKVDLSNCSEEYRKAYYDGWNNCNQQHSQCKSDGNDVVKCLINGMKFYYEGNEKATWGTEKFSMKVKDILSWLEKQSEHAKFCDSIQVGDKVTRNQDGVLVNLSQLKRVAKKDEKQGEQPKKHDVCDNCDQQGSCVSPCPMKLVEKQGEQKSIDDLTPQEAMDIAVGKCFEQGEQKPTDKVGPKFHKDEWITNGDYTWKIVEVNLLDYILQSQDGSIVDDTISHVDEQFHSFTIKDAKAGDVLMGNAPFIFNGNLEGGVSCPGAYCGINTLGNFEIPEHQKHWTGHNTQPATKEQRDTLMKAMADAGYIFDFEKIVLKKIEQKPAWSKEDETGFTNTIIMLKEGASLHFNKKDITKAVDFLKSLKDRVQPQNTWKPSEQEKAALRTAIFVMTKERNFPLLGAHLQNILDAFENKSRADWKPSDEQIEALEHFVRSIGESGYASPYDNNTKLLYSLLSDLKKLKE